MIFWKKKLHRLPKFPDTVAPIFRQLCEVLDNDQIQELRAAVQQNFEQVLVKSRDNDNLDTRSANDLTELCYMLLDRYFEFTPDKQKLIVGGVRYFAIADDPFDDATFATGFHDDKLVMNHVLEELDVHDHYFDVT